MKNQNLIKDNDLYTVAILLDAIGPEASLGRDAWEEIANLELSGKNGLVILVGKYLLPEYFGFSELLQIQYLNCLRNFLSSGQGELEEFPMDEYPYLAKTSPRLLFSILAEEINLALGI